MNVRKNWINTSSTDYHSVEDTIADVKNNYDIRRYYSAEGYSVKIDNITTQVIIQSHLNPLNQGNIDREIHMPIESVVRTGSIIEWDSDYWIIVSSIDDLSAYKSASMIKSNNTLSFYSPSTLTIHSIPCYIDSNVRLYSMGDQDSKFVSIPDSSIIVRVANTTITKEIKRNDIFLLSDIDNYKIVDINSIIEPGLIVFKMEWCAEEQVLPVFSIEILNDDILTTDINTPIQLNYQVKDHGIILTNLPSVIFISSDESIATVSNTGMVQPVGLGECTITVTLESSDATIKDSISITVEEVPVQESYYLELSGNISPDTEIKINYSKTYTCVKKNSLGEVIEGAFDFSINPGTTPSNAYTLTVINDVSGSIKCNQNTYYIDLVATDKSDNSLTVSKTIKLRSLM